MALSANNLRSLELGRAVRLKNKTCPYCGLAIDSATDEHVIGKKFVPLGSLNNQFNLILRACSECNNAKSALEDDISSISLFGRASNVQEDDIEAVKQIENKLAKSISRRTKRPVIDSVERVDVSFPILGGSARFEFVAPPQLDAKRAYQLAWYHFAGFFHFITYDEVMQSGSYWPGVYAPILYARRGDWGNPLFVMFMKLTADWPLRFVGTTAGGNFRIAIRRNPNLEVWSLAVEWNQSIRVIALCGVRNGIDEIFAFIPKRTLGAEVALQPEHDTLFAH